MTDRRAELEKKKLKLQQLRELKETRRLEKESRDRLLMSTASSRATPSLTSGSGTESILRSDISEVDDILESVGITTKFGLYSNISFWFPLMIHLAANSSPSKPPNEVAAPPADTHSEINDNQSQQQQSTTANRSTKLQSLSLTSFPQVSIAPKEQVTYEKQTQTASTQSTDRGLERIFRIFLLL